MTKVSNSRYSRCFSEGKKIETLFEEKVGAMGKTVVKATKKQDMFSHIDYWVDGYGVDVKSHRYESNIWLELTNVRGNGGWLKGKATYIAFHFTDKNEFRIFKRQDLLSFAENNNLGYTEDKTEYLKIYGRKKWNKLDEIVRVTYDHIKDLPHTIIKC